MLDNLKTWAITLLILSNLFGILGAYTRGKEAGENDLRSYYEAAERANDDFWQAKLDKISESYNQYRLNNELRFKGLQNEFIQKSNDLALCQYNTDQLRYIKTAANMQTTTSTKVGNATGARIIADSESRERFTCQDAGATMIAWGQQYFSCKAKLDYLQNIWTGNQ